MKLLNEIKRGQALSRKEQEKMLQYLGFKFPVIRFIISLIILLSGAFLVYVSLGRNPIMEEKSFFFAMGGALLLTIGFYSFFNHHKTERILNYFDALSDFTEQKFSKYDKYEINYVKNIKSPNNPLTTNKVYLLTDGFNIIIYEDFMENTDYLLPGTFKTNIRTVLPVFNYDTIDSKPFVYTINNIISYRINGREQNEFIWEPSKVLNKKTNARIEERVLLLDQFIQKENYIDVIIENGNIIKIDIDALDVLRQIMPNKEVK